MSRTGTERADVIVVGAGMAGLTCATRLAETAPGAQIVVLEAAPSSGGNAARAIGSIMAAGTAWQARAGYADDTSADHFEDLLGLIAFDADDPEGSERYRGMLRRMCAEAASGVHWLAERGVAFHGPSTEVPHRAPRMHNAIPDGSGLITPLLHVLADRGVLVLNGARVTRIAPDGERLTVQVGDDAWSSKSVVFAGSDRTGELSSAAPPIVAGDGGVLMRQLRDDWDASVHEPKFRAQLRTVGAGAPSVQPTSALLRRGALTWLRSGRQVPGTVATNTDSLMAVHRDEGEGDITLTVPEISRVEPVGTFPGIGWGLLDDLERCGLASRADDGIVIGPLRLVQTTSDGGLDVDPRMRVLSRSGGPVHPGLFAVGQAALGSIQLMGHGHHLLWALTSGMFAAESSSRRVA